MLVDVIERLFDEFKDGKDEIVEDPKAPGLNKKVARLKGGTGAISVTDYGNSLSFGVWATLARARDGHLTRDHKMAVTVTFDSKGAPGERKEKGLFVYLNTITYEVSDEDPWSTVIPAIQTKVRELKSELANVSEGEE